MKRPLLIGLVLLLAMASCRGPVETRHGTSLQPAVSPKLSAIDSLMWQQPDSALQALMAYEGDASEYNHHYAQLLTSELLYKNDYEQTNRRELQQAVVYFDSLLCQFPPLQRGLGGFKTRPDQTNQIAFLDARAHYINGVGYYERDSMIEACREYLKALEVMEGHFEEKEMVGEKARFMALVYTHLTGLFSDVYLHEQAIYFGKIALVYYNKFDAPSWNVAWILNEIGSHFDIMNQLDTADYYYQKSLSLLFDTTSLIYRDVVTRIANLSFRKKEGSESSLNQLHHLIALSKSEKEYFSRCLNIGEIYYHEKRFDSALVYLNKVFRSTQSLSAKKQAAEWLVEICKAQGREEEIIDYAGFLAPFATQDEDKGIIKSQLAEFCNVYKQHELEQRNKQEVYKRTRRSVIIIIGILVVMLSFVFLYWKSKRKKRNLEMQIKEEQYTHEMKQKALLGRLKQSNEALRIQKKKASGLAKKMNLQQKQANWNGLDDFMNENICKDILAALHGKQIKREAKCGDYPELHLNNVQLHDLSIAVEKHFSGFEKTLTDLYPRINRNALNQCLLYLLNMEDVQIAALLSCDYSTVKRRSTKLKEAFNTEKEPRQFIREIVLKQFPDAVF